MTRHTTVGVNNDLAAGKAGVPMRTADDETPRGIDEELDAAGLEPVFLQHRTDHFIYDGLLDRRVAELAAPNPLGVLSGDHYRADTQGTRAFILHRHLTLPIRPEPLDGTLPIQALAHRRPP